ncbi:hypothetical protein PR048_023428 [Dryococelus australis]|uniref:Uncharacterized protein n=1 Tax=Dryococelus australis TaxID=614101 RepID=A0ABQ9GU21_9NEOP|nr:hypothetical protein PR048_023428 [Dryococelus australis]
MAHTFIAKKKTLNEGKLVTVTLWLKGFITASEKRVDGLVDLLKNAERNKTPILVLSDCRQTYIRPSMIKKDGSNNIAASCVNVEENRQLRLRSLLKPFDISSDCLFCGEEASERNLPGNFNNEDMRVRPSYKHKEECFKKLCVFIDENENCQLKLAYLVGFMGENAYSASQLKDKLVTHYGDSIFITENPGRSSVVDMKGKPGVILYDKWYSKRKASQCDEKLSTDTMN